MAGKKRFAAKLVVLTTVLATGGAGAYYFTNGGVWPRVLGGRGDGASAQLLVDDAGQLSTADLDAVASSWATAGSSHQADDDTISPSARSADVTLARAETSPASPLTGGRYGVSSTSSTPVVVAATESSTTEADEPTPALAVEPSASTLDGRASLAAPDSQPVTVDAQETPALARGQDPNDDDNAADGSGEVSEPTSAADLAAEPKALQMPASTTDLSAAARRAREAFRDEPAGKAGTAAAASGRYATAASTTAAAARNSDAKEGAALVNPFASQPTLLPTTAGAAEPHDLVAYAADGERQSAE